MKRASRGKIIVLHLAFRYPFAGVVWQLLHHLIGFQRLGFEVYYVEDHGAYVYDPMVQSPVPDATANVKLVGPVLDRFGFSDRWSFIDPASGEYVGMGKERCNELFDEAAAVLNLCAASLPREEHRRCGRFVYLESDPGVFQVNLMKGEKVAQMLAEGHDFFFTYAYNIGAPDCRLPAGNLKWFRIRPPVLLDIWQPGVGPPNPLAFTSVGTWVNKGSDCTIDGETYCWSKHVNFVKVLDVPRLAGQAIELATDLNAGPDYARALAGGFKITPVIPMSLDIDRYREFLSSSRGEFTVAKDLYARTRSGWFSDRTACYLAAGRPVVTQFTGFEKYLPTGDGLLGFDDQEEATDAIARINGDYESHARAARELAEQYFDSDKLLEEITAAVGL